MFPILLDAMQSDTKIDTVYALLNGQVLSDVTESRYSQTSLISKILNIFYVAFMFIFFSGVAKASLVHLYPSKKTEVKRLKYLKNFDYKLPNFYLDRLKQKFGLKKQKRYRHTVKFEGLMTPLSRDSTFWKDDNVSQFGLQDELSFYSENFGSLQKQESGHSDLPVKESVNRGSSIFKTQVSDGISSVATDLGSIEVSVYDLFDSKTFSSGLSSLEEIDENLKPLDSLHVDYLCEQMCGYQMEMMSTKIDNLERLTNEIEELEERLYTVIRTRESEKVSIKRDVTDESLLSFKSRNSLLRQ